MLKRPPQRRRNRTSPGADFDELTAGRLAHHHTGGVAGQTLRRSRGNARAAVEDGLPGRLGVGEHGGVDVDDHLVPFSRRPWIDAAMKGRLGDERERIGLLLLERRGLFERSRGNVFGRLVDERPAQPRLLVQRLAGSVQRVASRASA